MSKAKHTVFYRNGEEANDFYLSRKNALKLAKELESNGYAVIVCKLDEDDDMQVIYNTIKWKGDCVYVNNIYAGYIDCMSHDRDAWYGRVFSDVAPLSSMESFGVIYNRDEMVINVEEYITDNYLAVLNKSRSVQLLNK